MASNSNYRPVLILRASPRISVAIARSLDCRGIPVEVAVSLGDDHQVNLPAIHALHRLSSRDQYPAQFLHSLLGLIRERDFDMVLPVNGPALCALGENYETLAPVLHLGCSAAIVVECVLNKAVTLEAAQKCGIKVPVTGTIDSFAELEQMPVQLYFPVLAKPGEKGAKVFRVRYFFSIYVGLGVEMLIHNGKCVA